MTAIKTSQIKSQLSGILKKYPEANIIGLKTAHQWRLESVLKVDDQAFWVKQCNSQLAIREAVLKAEQDDLRLAFVTPLEDPDLGDDLRTRLTKRRLISIKPWENVKALFKARNIDGSVFKNQWLADVIINQAPADGYAIAANGFLTAERLWQEVLALELHFATSRPDAADIIEWSLDEKQVLLLKKMDDSRFKDVCKWIEQGSESLEALLLRVLKTGTGFHLLALGLAFEVTSGEAEKGKTVLRDAAIRLEKYTGNKPMSPQLVNRFKEASLQVYHKLAYAQKKGLISEVQEKLDYLFTESGAQDFAWLSSVSLKGFEQRRSRFAESVDTYLAKGHEAQFKQAVERLRHAEKHWEAAASHLQLNRMRMALRLLRWLTFTDKHAKRAQNFAEAAIQYARDGGYADRARDSLRSGDECSELNQVYIRLIQQVETVRQRQNLHFATLLQQWTEAGSQSEDLLKIEDMLEKVIAPIAKQHRLLLIVMDGMNQAVFSEIKEDMISKHDWVELTHADCAHQKPVITVFPTITEVSRRTLLCGKLTADSKDSEANGFAKYGPLRASSGSKPPILFHKGALAGTGGTYLAETVRDEIHSARRVIGAVVNTVDDFLRDSDQIVPSWRIENLPVFSQLLHEARDAGRIVIITSDHGHVLDYHSQFFKYESGERWRPDDGNLKAGEIAIKGARVLKPASGKMIAPFSEHLRYGKKKNGYHGGVTPQEAVVPYTVMKWRQSAKGWEAAPFFQPGWWDIHIRENGHSLEALQAKSEAAPLQGQIALFTADKAAKENQTTDWIKRLLQSPVLADQKKICGQAVLSDETVCRFLKVLNDCAGMAAHTTLAVALAQPLFRMREIIETMQRILNVDGYQVLSFNAASDTVSIDANLLKTQFRI